MRVPTFLLFYGCFCRDDLWSSAFFWLKSWFSTVNSTFIMCVP